MNRLKKRSAFAVERRTFYFFSHCKKTANMDIMNEYEIYQKGLYRGAELFIKYLLQAHIGSKEILNRLLKDWKIPEYDAKSLIYLVRDGLLPLDSLCEELRSNNVEEDIILLFIIGTNAETNIRMEASKPDGNLHKLLNNLKEKSKLYCNF